MGHCSCSCHFSNTCFNVTLIRKYFWNLHSENLFETCTTANCFASLKCLGLEVCAVLSHSACPGFDCRGLEFDCRYKFECCPSDIRTLSRALSSIFQHCPEHRRPTMLGTIFASIVDNVRTLLWRSLPPRHMILWRAQPMLRAVCNQTKCEELELTMLGK